ncbi:PREDICTED: zinc carboxypeptidase-like [Rhagoletis zephyria]|uniref:zinc carboxypeptidase-like n=1 Tax=Rhagoletis zephyria TaxID=28612 RepID=UPI00081167D5|nr:PREDICTED: zinc carboxypeptidase-like [Rhagoletis zephyria]
MKSLILVIASLVIFLALGSASKVRYDNFKVFKIRTKNVEQQQMIEKLAANSENFNLWHSGNKEVHIMVSPQKVIHLQNYTRAYSLPLEVMVSNVQSLIDGEQLSKSTDDSTFGWTRYYPLSAIEAFLDEILAKYPAVTSAIDIGTSYEGRKIRGIKISYKEGNPGIFIESNIHAREWITSATATWLINEFLTSTDEDVRSLAENHDWYIVPVLNVDGFVYTHDTDRMWRKTRQPVNFSSCIGADPNRNFDSHWMENNGASADPCAQTYAGTEPFSEPEVKAIADYIASIKERLNILIAFHSYGQLLLSPYGWTGDLPSNYDDLMAVAEAYSNAVKAMPYGTEYTYGTSSGALYFASGATNDWAYSEQDIRLSYTIEFRDTGRFGFILPPVQIIPQCEDALAGLLAFVKKADELGYLEVKYT